MKKKKKRPPSNRSGTVFSGNEPFMKEGGVNLEDLKTRWDKYGPRLPISIGEFNSLLGTNYGSIAELVKNIKSKHVNIKIGKFMITIDKMSSKSAGDAGRVKKWIYGIITALLSSGIITWVIDLFIYDII